MHQMFLLGDGSALQAAQFSSQTVSLWSHVVVIREKDIVWMAADVPLKPVNILFSINDASQMSPSPCALMHPYTIMDAGF